MHRIKITTNEFDTFADTLTKSLLVCDEVTGTVNIRLNAMGMTFAVPLHTLDYKVKYDMIKPIARNILLEIFEVVHD